MTQRQTAIIVGAGPAGLAAAAELGRRRIPAAVLERGDAVGASWYARYDRLRLNSSRWFSQLPGARYARGVGAFPSRDEMVRYLDRYAHRYELDVRLRTSVERIDRDGDGWVVRTSAGDLAAPHVVVAAGYLHTATSRSGPAATGSAGRSSTPRRTATRAVRGPRRPRRRLRLHRHGDCLRPRGGRRVARPPRRADAAEHPPPLAGRCRSSRRSWPRRRRSAATRSSTRCASRSSATSARTACRSPRRASSAAFGAGRRARDRRPRVDRGDQETAASRSSRGSRRSTRPA